jgi:heme exporter protein C
VLCFISVSLERLKFDYMKSNNWWKFLGVVLVVYTLIAGLLIPLKPGIVDRNTNQAKTGTELIIKVRGYNADYTQYANAQAWLKLDSVHAIKAKQIRHLDKRTIQLSFSIPTSLPDTSVGHDTRY